MKSRVCLKYFVHACRSLTNISFSAEGSLIPKGSLYMKYPSSIPSSQKSARHQFLSPSELIMQKTHSFTSIYHTLKITPYVLNNLGDSRVSYEIRFNPLQPSVAFLHPLKSSENLKVLVVI